MKNANETLAELGKQYEQMITSYAMQLFHDKIVPVCVNRELSFNVSGCLVPEFRDKNGKEVEIPDELLSLFEGCTTSEGDPLHYYFIEDFNPFNICEERKSTT